MIFARCMFVIATVIDWTLGDLDVPLSDARVASVYGGDGETGVLSVQTRRNSVIATPVTLIRDDRIEVAL